MTTIRVIGLIGTAGFSSTWRTRDNIEQTPGSADLSVIDKDYRRVGTDNRAVTNAMLGLAYEFGAGSKLRWTNFYIHDTLKHTSLASGFQNNQRLGADLPRADHGLVRAPIAQHPAHRRYQARSR